MVTRKISEAQVEMAMAAPGVSSLASPCGQGWEHVFAWTCLLSFLVICVPLFICMPLWVDAYFYDVCARNVLQGGVHYRDVFDTNFPGMVWGHAAVRTIFGWRPEGLRLVDLTIFAGIVWLLMRRLQNLQITPVARIWTAFALFAFYFSVSESCHCQRDVWMLFLALLAVELRLRRMDKLLTSRPASAPAGCATICWAWLEGMLWGAAVWIKPFVVVPAGLCWLVSVGVLVRAEGAKRRFLVADTAALVAGGLAAGAAGALWLLSSGAWPYFWGIMLEWNPEYQALFSTFSHRYSGTKTWALATLPWSLVHLAAIPLAALAIFRALGVSPGAGVPLVKLSVGGLLAALYLGWLVQALTLQNCHDYVLMPAVLMGLVVCAAFVRLSGALSLARWSVVAAFVGFAAGRFELKERLGLWASCFTEGSTPELRDRLALSSDQNGRIDWQDLKSVENFLRAQVVADGELTCFNDCTFPLYLEMGLLPSTRYMYFNLLVGTFVRHREQVRSELGASRQRFVVADLVSRGITRVQIEEFGNKQSVSSLPGAAIGESEPFPWCEPVVFRSGRYVVFRVTGLPTGL